MSNTGIQCKFDHPCVKPVLQVFATAYGLTYDTVLKMTQAGEIIIRMASDGIWVEFVSSMSEEESGRALAALSMLTQAKRRAP